MLRFLGKCKANILFIYHKLNRLLQPLPQSKTLAYRRNLIAYLPNSIVIWFLNIYRFVYLYLNSKYIINQKDKRRKIYVLLFNSDTPNHTRPERIPKSEIYRRRSESIATCETNRLVFIRPLFRIRCLKHLVTL